MRPRDLLSKWDNLLFLVFIFAVLFRQVWLIAFSVAVSVVFIAARIWNYYALSRITYRRLWRYRRGFPGESLTVRILTANEKILPLPWLRTTDPWPLAVGPLDESLLSPSHIADQGNLVNLYSLRWFEKVERTVALQLRQRGIYDLGPTQLQSGDPFGLFDNTVEHDNQEYLTVFPEVLPLERLKLDAEDPFGDRRARRRLVEDPTLPIGVRDYHPEDDFRHIHWPATARSGQMQVRMFQPVSSQVMVVCLNVSTAEQPWLGTYHTMLEQLVKVAASLVVHGVEDGYAVGLISNGCLAHADRPFRILPGRSRDQLSLLLQTLAAVTPYTTTPFEKYLVKAASNLPYGATLLIVTALVTPALLETLISIRRYRTHTTLICLQAAPPPTIPGVHVLHLPFSP